MKKIIKTLVIAMMLVMVVMAFAACTKEDPCANGHKFEAFGEDLPTCTKDGLSSGVVCTVCGYAERTRFPIPAKGHKMAAATCDAPSTCTVCGITEGEALGHDMVEVEALAPTCTTEGYNAHLGCSRCDYTEGKEVVEIDPDAHTLVDVEAKEPGCEDTPGYTAHKACECGYTEGKEAVTVEGHDFDENELFYHPSAPTCTEGTYIAGYCTGCGKGFLLEEVAALGHVDENEDNICDRCEGEMPHTHNFSDATCTEPAKCECGATEGEALGHDMNAATCTLPATCKICGATEGEALGHIDENGDVECDREGCTSKVAPPAETVLSNYTANCLGSKLSVDAYYYVVGTIVEVLDQKNGIFLVDDGTGETFYFRLPKNADGVSHASWEIKLTLGDKVQIYGKINKYSTTSAPNGQYYPAMQSPVVTLLEQHEHDFTSSPADCSDPAYCVCGQSYGDPRGCVDADANDICDDCGKNVNYTYEYIEIRTDNASGVIDTTAGTYTWGNANFDVQVVKGTSSQLYSTAKDHMRVYKGNDFVLVNKNGVAVKTITVYLTNATQVGNFEKFLTGYTYTKNEANLSITFEVDALETLTLTNTASTTQIKGVEFGYEKPEPSKAVMDNTITDTQTSYMTDGNNAELVGLDPSIFTVTSGKGSVNQHVTLYYKSSLAVPSQLRFWNHSSANGNSITVSVAEGYEILSIKITFAITGRANGYIITDASGNEIANVATDATIENVEVEYDVNSASFTLKNVHTGSAKQIWIDSIEIVYQPK